MDDNVVLMPNTTQVPNTILDNLAGFSDTELRILLVVTRQTLGWSKARDWLSGSQIQERTGRKKSAIKVAILSLTERGFIEMSTEDGAILATSTDRQAAGQRHQKAYYALDVTRQGRNPAKAWPKSGQGHGRNPATTKPTLVQNLLVTKKTRLAKPTASTRKKISYEASWYKQVLDAYQEIRGLDLRGPEFSPLQQTIKTIFMAGHEPADAIGLMHALEDSEEEWTCNWTLRTVKMKLPEWRAGKLTLQDEQARIREYDRRILAGESA